MHDTLIPIYDDVGKMVRRFTPAKRMREKYAHRYTWRGNWRIDAYALKNIDAFLELNQKLRWLLYKCTVIFCPGCSRFLRLSLHASFSLPSLSPLSLPTLSLSPSLFPLSHPPPSLFPLSLSFASRCVIRWIGKRRRGGGGGADIQPVSTVGCIPHILEKFALFCVEICLLGKLN